MDSSKMYCPSRCRYRTYQCGAANYPVSWGVVQRPEWKYAKIRPYQSPWYCVCINAMVILKGSYEHGEFKNVLPQSVQVPSYQCGAANYPVSWGVVQGPEWKYAKLRPYPSSWYRVCTKAMVMSKGSYGHGEFKNVLPQSVQIPYLPVRGRKLPRFIGGIIEPRMEVCETSALPIPIVPHLHQSNRLKRKLRAWRVQKCIALVGADTVLTSSWPPTTPFHGWYYRAQNGNMRNFGPTNPHGTAFAPKQSFEKEATGMESSKMYCPSRYRYRTYQCMAANYPVSWGVVQGPEWKYAKLRPYQSPWYRGCTKATVIVVTQY